MDTPQTYTFIRRKRTKTTVEVQMLRLRQAKASLEIEGLYLTADEIAVFEECIRKACSFEERTARLKARFPHYDQSLRT